MIVDTSAIIAILRGEPEGEGFASTILAAGGAQISAASYVEVGAVVDRVGDPVLSRRLDELLELLHIDLVPFDAAQARASRAAYLDFGKGSNHPAGLNFGDCLTYGLAKTSGLPLLFVGNDFSVTDLQSAMAASPPNDQVGRWEMSGSAGRVPKTD
jgi:ribonuclease VapC